jgi:hypothetical protein
VSPNRGRHIVRQAPPKRLERPSLDRPSLFAGMEAGDSIVPEDDDNPRGGILSTLETVRQRKPLPGRHDGDAGSAGGLWQNRILWGLMGAGVVALLGSFVLIVSEGHSRKQEAAMERAVLAKPMDAATAPVRDLNVLAAPAAGDRSTGSPPAQPESTANTSPTPLAAATATATIVDAGLSQPGPAVAGVVPTPSLKATAPLSPVPPMPAITPEPAPAAVAAQEPPVGARVNNPPQASAAPVPQVPQAPPVVAQASAQARDKATEKVTKKAADKATNKATASEVPQARRSTRKQQDDDVALLEAMFQHSQTRSGGPAAGPSVAQQLRSKCGKLDGAAAATCRARICVSNPGAQACHDSP